MTEGPKTTHRIAIGVFTEMVRLNGALRDLDADPPGPCSLRVVSTTSGLDAVGAGLDDGSRFLEPALAAPLEVIGTLPNGTSIVSAPAVVRNALWRGGVPRVELLYDLESELSGGAVALLVETVDAKSLAHAMRVLLRHSLHRVRASETYRDPKA